MHTLEFSARMNCNLFRALRFGYLRSMVRYCNAWGWHYFWNDTFNAGIPAPPMELRHITPHEGLTTTTTWFERDRINGRWYVCRKKVPRASMLDEMQKIGRVLQHQMGIPLEHIKKFADWEPLVALPTGLGKTGCMPPRGDRTPFAYEMDEATEFGTPPSLDTLIKRYTPAPDCRCIDCGGDQPGHDPTCEFMLWISGADEVPVRPLLKETDVEELRRRYEANEPIDMTREDWVVENNYRVGRDFGKDVEDVVDAAFLQVLDAVVNPPPGYLDEFVGKENNEETRAAITAKLMELVEPPRGIYEIGDRNLSWVKEVPHVEISAPETETSSGAECTCADWGMMDHLPSCPAKK